MKKLLLLLSVLALGIVVFAQTPGVIIKDAGIGAGILDPDSDGYISVKTNGEQLGFTNPPNSDFIQSEISFVPIVKEDISDDLIQGPGCMFTDIVGDSLTEHYAALVSYDGTNLIFRLRIADLTPNSKGYSILIDCDQKFGFIGENADPNALFGNKGFEVEIALMTKQSVSVYLVDGSVNPELVTENSYDDYSQESLAGSNFCDQQNYFFDFYIPFYQLSSIPSLNITTATPLRFAVVTNISPKPSIGSLSISDIGGSSSTQTFDDQTSEVIAKQTAIVVSELYDEENDPGGCPPISENCVADTTEWIGAVSSDWANDSNWSNHQPTYCSQVVIPTLTEEIYYPIISCPTACNSITFKSGGAVFGLQLLTYNKVYVQLILERSNWYTQTPPLKNMYAGDYYFQGSPVTYMKYFDQIEANDMYYQGRNTGMWSTSISEQNTSLINGEGYYNYIATKTFHYPNPITYETENLPIQFPRTNPDGSLLTYVYLYHSSTGMPYYETPVELPRYTSTAYRFAMEDAENVLQNGKIAINPGLNLLGNPYMSHIDFDALYSSNTNKIANKVKYWNGTTFTTYMAGSGISSNKDFPGSSIAPMQGFFVEGIAMDSIEIDISSNFCANLGLTSSADTTNVLHIATELGVRKSSTAVTFRANASNQLDVQDAFKLFSQYTDVPEVYTVVEEIKLDINQFNTLPYMVPIGIYSEMSGNILFTFDGANSFENIDVTLLNTNTGDQQDLKTNNQYSLPYEGETATDGYLFVEFKSAGIATNNKEPEFCENCIRVYQKDHNVIGIISRSDDKIQNITVWEQSGIMLYNSNKVNRSMLDVPVNVRNKTCVVRVATEENAYVVKLLMKE